MSWAPVVWIFGVKGFGQPANLNVLIWVIKIETSKVSIETNTASLSENKQKNPVTYLFNQNQVNWCMDGKALQKLPFFFQKSMVLFFYLTVSTTAEMKGKQIIKLFLTQLKCRRFLHWLCVYSRKVPLTRYFLAVKWDTRTGFPPFA